MPVLTETMVLKLDETDATTMLASRIAERDAAIVAADHERKRARSEKSKGANHADTKKAEKDRDDAKATAATHESAFKATVDAVKIKHAATDLVATDEGHDPAAGTWVMKHEPLLSGLAPIEDKRLALTDAQCDAWVASYRASTQAQYEAWEYQRQISAYLVAHPPINGEPGHLIPEPQALLDLRAALAAKQKVVADEMAVQGAIFATVLADAHEDPGNYTYIRSMDPATGEIVLGRTAMLTKFDEVVLKPGDGEPTKERP